jgi:hypothetical protein
MSEDMSRFLLKQVSDRLQFKRLCPESMLDRENLPQRRKENPLETRQRFAPLRLCVRNLLEKYFSGKASSSFSLICKQQPKGWTLNATPQITPIQTSV